MRNIGRLSPNRRYFFVGLNTGYVTNGEPDQRFLDFYARRSSPALYCAIVGNVVIPQGYGTNASTATISRSPVWASVAQAISERGTLPGIQLATTWAGYQGSRTFRPLDAAETIDRSRELVRQMGRAEISKVLTALEDGALMALDAGFRHIQFHAAHGYLFSLLIDDRIYEGADEILARLIEWFEATASAGAETSIRLSLRTGDPRFDAFGREHFYDRVVRLRTDFIDVSSGYYNIDKQLIYPARSDTLQARRAETLALAAQYPETQFILSGRALMKSEEGLHSNVHIGLCRDLIANPDFLESRADGCINSGECHYFSRGAAHISCPQWKRALR